MSNLEAVIVEAKKLGLSGTVNSGIVISVGVKLATFVSNLPGLKGKEKSELVVSALVKCLDEIEASSACDEAAKARYEHLKDTARVAVPSAIQAVIDVSNGKFSIKTVKASTILSWFSCISSSAVSVVASTGLINAEQVKEAEKVLEKVAEKVAVAASGEVEKIAGAPVSGEPKEVEKVVEVKEVEKVADVEKVAEAAVNGEAKEAVVVVVEEAAAEVPVPVAEVPPVAPV